LYNDDDDDDDDDGIIIIIAMNYECESGLLWKNQHVDVGERKGC
jgi:hypothetical protein